MTEDLADEDIRQLELSLHKLAEAEGCCLTATFHEYQSGSYSVFSELMSELKRTQTRHPILRHQMLNRLDNAGVRVWVVEP